MAVEAEKASYQDYEPGKVFIVICHDCGYALAEGLQHCQAQEFAFDHARREGHFNVTILNENDMDIETLRDE